MWIRCKHLLLLSLMNVTWVLETGLCVEVLTSIVLSWTDVVLRFHACLNLHVRFFLKFKTIIIVTAKNSQD